MAEFNQFREALADSIALLNQEKNEEALELLDKSIVDAIGKHQIQWIRTLSHHAAIISNHIGNLRRVKHYYEQSLAFDSVDPAALYGLADLARRQGEVEIARQFAARCQKAIVEGNDEIMKEGLLDLVLLHWPELAER
jgi:tetratricopeptide (TPR) repeat protein